MKDRIARAIAAALALLLVLGFFLLPFESEELFAGEGGRKKEDIPTERELTWNWEPHLEQVNTLTLTLSGTKKAGDMTVYAVLREENGKEAAAVRQSLADQKDGDSILLQGDFRKGKTYTLGLRAEGEGTIRIKGSEEEGGFYPLLRESGSSTVRNPALLYFAAGLLLLAMTPVTTKASRLSGPLNRRRRTLEDFLPWGTFLLLMTVGVLVSLNKPEIDSGSPWRTWDEDDVHQFVVAGMLPQNTDSLRAWLNRVITWYPGYLPLALGGMLAGIFTGDALSIYRAEILMSTLAYAVMAGLAVRHAPRYKATFMAAGTLPAILFQMTSRTYDTVVTGSILLGLALVLESMEREEPVSFLRALTMTALMAFGTVAKPAYSLILLSLLLIPADRFGGRKRAWAFRAFVLLILGWCLAALTVPGAYDSVRGGDERFAGANASEQISWILANPGQGLTVPFLYFWNRQHTLMNMGISHWAYLGNNLEWNDLFLTLLLWMAPLCAWGEDTERGKLLTPGRRIVLGLIAFGAELSLIVTQFIVSSPVGGNTVEGMQARYFIPLWIVLAVALMAPLSFRKRISRQAGSVMTVLVFIVSAWVNISYAVSWLTATGCLG